MMENRLKGLRVALKEIEEKIDYIENYKSKLKKLEEVTVEEKCAFFDEMYAQSMAVIDSMAQRGRFDGAFDRYDFFLLVLKSCLGDEAEDVMNALAPY